LRIFDARFDKTFNYMDDESNLSEDEAEFQYKTEKSEFELEV